MAAAGIEGSVLLEAVVDTSGHVIPGTVRVLDSSHDSFEAPAVALLRESRFESRRAGGLPAEVLVRIPVRFELGGVRNVSAADSAAAAVQVIRGEQLARDGNIAEAMRTYRAAQTLDPRQARHAAFWLPLCWYGSLWGQATEVLWTCEQAVATAPGQVWARDARGIARALTGDTEGAINDLTAFANRTTSERDRSERLTWVAALRAGQNPFTADVLASLRRREPRRVP
jgi:TonB family protein